MRPDKVEENRLRGPIVTEEAVIYRDHPGKAVATNRPSQDGRTPQMQGDCGDVFRSWAHR